MLHNTVALYRRTIDIQSYSVDQSEPPGAVSPVARYILEHPKAATMTPEQIQKSLGSAGGGRRRCKVDDPGF